MKTSIECLRDRWIKIPVTDTKHQEIEDWVKTVGIDVRYDGVFVNPNTFQTEQRWFVITEEDKTIFLLKWS